MVQFTSIREYTSKENTVSSMHNQLIKLKVLISPICYPQLPCLMPAVNRFSEVDRDKLKLIIFASWSQTQNGSLLLSQGDAIRSNHKSLMYQGNIK